MPVMFLTLNPNPILCSIGLDQHNYLVYGTWLFSNEFFSPDIILLKGQKYKWSF